MRSWLRCRPGADCSIQAIGDRVFTDPGGYSVDALYREMSEQKVSFSGQGGGPLHARRFEHRCLRQQCVGGGGRCTGHSGRCGCGHVCAQGVSAAVEHVPGCGPGGSRRNAEPCVGFTCDVPHVYAHELGHNLGMHHAATETSEYGDDSDIMGMLGGLLPVNAPHKTQMGWLGASATQEVTQPGLYDIAPLALAGSAAAAPQVLKIQKPGSSDVYYVSYRHGTGFEANACCSYLDRISVHRWSGGGSRTYHLASLADGESYTDPSSGFSVSQVSHGSVTATARIELGAMNIHPGQRVKPKLRRRCCRRAIRPVLPALSVRYDVTIVNQDSGRRIRDRPRWP